MKLLLIIAALGCAILALVCFVAPTTIGITGTGWIAASLVSYFAAILAGLVPISTIP
jgi:hypothetical protein